MEKSVSYGDDSTNKNKNPNLFKLESPFLQFNGGNAGSLTVTLFYDTYEHGKDVRDYTNQVSDLMKIDPEIHAPPPLKFVWGMEKEPFICVLKSVKKEFTMFLPEGIPVRARVTLTLKEFKMKFNEREIAKQSPDKTKVHVTQRGDSLWLIANKAYGNPKFWRPIADRNGIKNPRFLEPGKELIIPPLE